ncbi:MAG: S9 family peptidase [Candidatus Aminicenantes bacterium]|nr:MAG: S9 family peptidase [Candidatus Aminicenantes bacterium]
MRARFIIQIALIMVLSCLVFGDTEKKPFSVDDAINMVSVSNPQISPDGKWILYTKSELKWDDNKRERFLWVVSADGGEAFKYTNTAGDSSPQWSPDGKYLAFLRGRGKKRQIWLMRTTGGEATQLTKHKGAISSFKWCPESKGFIFQASDIKSKEEKEKEKKGDDVVYVYEGPNGQYSRGSWSNLWHFCLECKEEKQITKEKMRVQSYDVSPDGKRIVYIYRTENQRNTGNLSEIALVTIPEGTISRLTNNHAPERSPLWAPDGKRIIYIAPDDKNWKLANSKIWLMDVGTREYRIISGKFEGNIRGYRWSPDGKFIIFNGSVRTKGNIFSLDVNSGDVKQLTEKEGSMRFSSFSRNLKKAACMYSDNQTPSDIWLVDLDLLKEKKLTDANPWVKDRIFATMKVIQWKSNDGLPIEGLLYLPADYKQGQKLPLILNIHGGPAGVYTNRFSSGMHIFAGLGYASLAPNVRGSSGYTDKLLRGNMEDIGGGDYWDLITGVDEVIKKGIADRGKLGVRGWSYGGILGGWTLTQTDRFKAAALGAMVSDWASEYGMGFSYDVRLWYIGGTPWDNPEKYREMSSLTHIKNVKTPVILFHGERDTTCTIGQSMNYFTALHEMGKTVRFLRFPREPHGFREPHHQRIRTVEEIAWMQKHIQGIEWTCERPKEKKEEEKEKEKDKN